MTERGRGPSGVTGAQRPHATACHRGTARWWDGGPLGRTVGLGGGAVPGPMAGTGPAMTGIGTGIGTGGVTGRAAARESGRGASGNAGAQRPHATACHRATTRRWDGGPLGREAIWHSIIIAVGVTILATSLGTLAAVGLANPRLPARRLIIALLISPLIVPVIITAVGAYIFYASIGLASTFSGIILAHTVVASPFVVVTVGASLSNFDRDLMRAAAISGAPPLLAFRRVMLPAILPGVLSGAAFAFVTSFDELVISMFLASADQRTLPMLMFTGLREHLSPAITAAATMMMSLSIVLLIVADRLRRRR